MVAGKRKGANPFGGGRGLQDRSGVFVPIGGGRFSPLHPSTLEQKGRNDESNQDSICSAHRADFSTVFTIDSAQLCAYQL